MLKVFNSLYHISWLFYAATTYSNKTFETNYEQQKLQWEDAPW